MIEHMEDGGKLFTINTTDILGVEMAEKAADSIEIEQRVPFITRADHLIGSATPLSYVEGRLAAEFSSKVDNPYFKPPTAEDLRNGAVPSMFLMFGPYFLATDKSPLAVADEVVGRADEYLEKLEYETGEDGAVGALLGVLRSEHLGSGPQRRENINLLRRAGRFLGEMAYIRPGPNLPDAIEYCAKTHDVVDGFADTLRVQQSQQGVKEKFWLPNHIRSNPSNTITLGVDHFTSFRQRRALTFASLAAEKAGHPFVRSTLLANPYGF
jgi:hypothetical protein